MLELQLQPVLPRDIQGRFSLGLIGLISLLSRGLSRVFSNITVQKYQFLGVQPSFMVQLLHLYMATGKTIALTVLHSVTSHFVTTTSFHKVTIHHFVSKGMFLLFNTLSLS